jgi:deoxycytidine triphosphate deaminase
MDILTTPKGTLFRLFRETFVTTSEPYYCPHHKIHKVKAHNITLGTDQNIGQVAMLGAYPFTQETK